jgi:hypothetical protein
MNKTVLIIFTLLNICSFVPAQTKNNKQMFNELDSTAVFLLHRISQHTAPCYKLYKTENMWTFLELETFSGRIWQVQYSINDEETPRMKTFLNLRSLATNKDEEFAGRFELYPTQNMYNFILLDTYTGKTWQAQWSIDYKNRGIVEIK